MQINFNVTAGISLKMTQMIHFWVDPSNNIETIMRPQKIDLSKCPGSTLEWIWYQKLFIASIL